MTNVLIFGPKSTSILTMACPWLDAADETFICSRAGDIVPFDMVGCWRPEILKSASLMMMEVLCADMRCFHRNRNVSPTESRHMGYKLICSPHVQGL